MTGSLTVNADLINYLRGDASNEGEFDLYRVRETRPQPAVCRARDNIAGLRSVAACGDRRRKQRECECRQERCPKTCISISNHLNNLTEI